MHVLLLRVTNAGLPVGMLFCQVMCARPTSILLQIYCSCCQLPSHLRPSTTPSHPTCQACHRVPPWRTSAGGTPWEHYLQAALGSGCEDQVLGFLVREADAIMKLSGSLWHPACA